MDCANSRVKTCTKCNTSKHETEFRFLRPGQLKNWCRDCGKAASRAYREQGNTRLTGGYPWQPDPLNVVFVNWLQVRA